MLLAAQAALFAVARAAGESSHRDPLQLIALASLLAWAWPLHALVGHAHVAMAGMASSFGALVLLMLNRGTRLADVLAAPRPFAWWQAGTALHVAAVAAAGALEARDPGVLFRPDLVVTALYALRALAGGLMLAAAASWMRRALAEAR